MLPSGKNGLIRKAFYINCFPKWKLTFFVSDHENIQNIMNYLSGDTFQPTNTKSFKKLSQYYLNKRHSHNYLANIRNAGFLGEMKTEKRTQKSEIGLNNYSILERHCFHLNIEKSQIFHFWKFTSRKIHALFHVFLLLFTRNCPNCRKIIVHITYFTKCAILLKACCTKIRQNENWK